MQEHPIKLDKEPGGWTLIVLLIVVAIIALLMAIYLPSAVLGPQDEEGNRKPHTEHVKDMLAPIGDRNQKIDDLIDEQSGSKKEPDEEEPQDDYEE